MVKKIVGVLNKSNNFEALEGAFYFLLPKNGREGTVFGGENFKTEFLMD